MAGHNLTGFIVLNELANFKGTPRKLAELEERLKEKFPKLGSKKFARNLKEAAIKYHLEKTPLGFSDFIPEEESYLNLVVS